MVRAEIVEGGAAPVGVTAPARVPLPERPTVMIVVPVYNESASIPRFLDACDEAFQGLDFAVEYLFVDDGSSDGTRQVLDASARARRDLTALHLSRNFGKEAALSAALDHAKGDAIVPMDVDLQDPPEVVVQFVEKWREGYDVVLGRRADRSSDSAFKRWSATAFYRVINAISDTPVPAGVGDFRLLDRRVVSVMRTLPERSRFTKGLFAWVGFETATVDYERKSRSQGSTSWSPWRLWNFAWDGITAFSSVPLRVWTYVGVLVALACLAFAALVVVLQLAGEIAISGYASLIVAVTFVGSIQLISFGLMGEYMARLMSEAKERPVYVIESVATPGGVAASEREDSSEGEGRAWI